MRWLSGRILPVALFTLLLLIGARFAAATPPNSGGVGNTIQALDPDAEHAESHADDGHGGGHSDPFAGITLVFFAIIVAGMLGRWMAEKTGQPAVLGELIIGILIGNLGYAYLENPIFTLIMNLEDAQKVLEQIWLNDLSVDAAAQKIFEPEELIAGRDGYRVVQAATGPDSPQYVMATGALWMFSNLGVILLLFMVGLESSVEEMLAVGPRATAVALIGIVAPFGLGYGATVLLLPESSTPVRLFIAATMCATSVGITARVFKDLGKLQMREAKLILGAAVIDDVLGLIILAIVIGIVATGEIHALEIAKIAGLAFGFIGVVILFGDAIVRFKLRLFRGLDRSNYALLFPLALAFLLAWVANAIQLAMIVGAFAAGLVIREEFFDDEFATQDKHHARLTLEERFAPLERLFAPVFFVLVGMQVNLESMRDAQTLWIGGALTVVAIVGKLVCGFPVGRSGDFWTVGIGMVPRGEVGLIFATVGKGLGVVDDQLFAAIVVMVIVTTLVTPLGLKWSLARMPGAAVPPAQVPQP